MKNGLCIVSEKLRGKIVDALSHIPEAIAAYIIGSVASGRERGDSDFDLAVVVDRKKPRDEERIYKTLQPISFPLNLDLSVVDTGSSPLFLFQIIKSGDRVYLRTEKEVLAFESFAMCNYYDTAYMRSIYDSALVRRFSAL